LLFEQPASTTADNQVDEEAREKILSEIKEKYSKRTTEGNLLSGQPIHGLLQNKNICEKLALFGVYISRRSATN
jgi:hypothetical protein